MSKRGRPPKGSSSSKGNGGDDKEAVSYELRDVVLGKIRGYPPWPGMVVEPTTAPPKVQSERPSNKKVFYLVRFFPTGDYSWLLAKDMSRLQLHEIDAYINEPFKKSGELLEGYRIARDPRDWEAGRLAPPAEEEEESDDADGDAEEEGVDELKSDGEGAAGEKKKGRKRKRDLEGGASESVSGKKAGKGAGAKKEKGAGTLRKKASLGGKKGKKSRENVESEDEGGRDGDGEADPDAEGGTPPAKKVKKGDGEDEETDDPESKRVREWRHKLQKTFLPSSKEKDKEPTSKPPRALSPQEITEADHLFKEVESYDKMTVAHLSFSKIGKVMRHIAALPASKVQEDEQYHFRDRAKGLVERWHLILGTPGSGSAAAKTSSPVTAPAPAASAEANGAATANGNESGEKLERPPMVMTETQEMVVGAQGLDLNGDAEIGGPGGEVTANGEEDVKMA